jgi:hypothetical protein
MDEKLIPSQAIRTSHLEYERACLSLAISKVRTNASFQSYRDCTNISDLCSDVPEYRSDNKFETS